MNGVRVGIVLLTRANCSYGTVWCNQTVQQRTEGTTDITYCKDLHLGQKLLLSLIGLLLQLLFVARLAFLTTENLVGHGNLELSKGSCKGSFVITHSLVGHKQGVSQKVVFNHRKNLVVEHGKHR